MPKASARDSMARKGRIAIPWLERLGRTLMFVVVLGMVLSVFAGRAEARRAAWYNNRHYSLSFSMGYEFSRSWNNRGGKISQFRQVYNLGHTGYVFDPRLVTYGTSLSFADTMGVENSNAHSDSVGFSLRVTLFQGINRDKGISMWKYAPSPIGLNYTIGKTFGGRWCN